MKYWKTVLVLGMVMMGSVVFGQDTLKTENIPTLNRVAGEYDQYKLIFSVVAGALLILTPLGFWILLKTKTEEWVLNKIAKEAELKVEHVKSAVLEFARIAELKKKRIMIISAEAGQQTNVKKVFDGCGFSNIEWKNMADLPSLVLQNTDMIVLNDQPEQLLTRVQIESVFEKFKTNVAYQYFGPKNDLPIGEYRKRYPQINLGLCNSADRLETGILSLLKII